MKYFRDRSLHFNKTTYDHTDYTGISTTGRIYQFESSNTANDIEGRHLVFRHQLIHHSQKELIIQLVTN